MRQVMHRLSSLVIAAGRWHEVDACYSASRSINPTAVLVMLHMLSVGIVSEGQLDDLGLSSQGGMY